MKRRRKYAGRALLG